MMKMSLNDIGINLSDEELLELEAAEKKDIIFDDDSPEMTMEMLNQFKRMNQQKRVKQTVSIRLSPKAMDFSKAYGKGYTSFLSRLVDAALDDENLVKKCVQRNHLEIELHSIRIKQPVDIEDRLLFFFFPDFPGGINHPRQGLRSSVDHVIVFGIRECRPLIDIVRDPGSFGRIRQINMT